MNVALKWSLPSKETLRGHSDSSFRGEGYIQCCVGVRLCDMYSNQELAEIHFMYGKADGNAALARRLYQERYPQRQCPDRKTFARLHYSLCEYGKFNSMDRAHLGQKAWVDITARLEKPTYFGRNDHDFKIKCRKQKTDVVKRGLPFLFPPLPQTEKCERERAGSMRKRLVSLPQSTDVECRLCDLSTIMWRTKETGVHEQNDEKDLKTKVNDRILQDRRTSLDELHIAFPDISRSLLGEIVSQHLGYHKICARWVPRQLSDQHKTQRMASASTFLMRYHTDGDAFLDQIVTGDETWVSHNSPETKRQSRQWHHPSSPKKPRKFKQTLSTQKVMATVFWDREGVLLLDFMPKSTTINANRYYLAPSDFHLFTKLKDFLGGTRFGSDEELKKTVNTWLNELAAEENNTGILKLKRAKKAQPLVFTVERAEAGGGNRDAT
ncbi:hypothetical protein ANN_23992 [Periplaneta americana]|uniref:DUF4817 domain-containing protein n=1 Tax=Periplaneta americana TaxID=6978 RepID=A0ABQ8S1V4_PERAM|nr:hypothetical protein ANN_23992 [Periplaneta americana]